MDIPGLSASNADRGRAADVPCEQNREAPTGSDIPLFALVAGLSCPLLVLLVVVVELIR